MSLSRSPSPTLSYSSTATTLVSSNTEPSDHNNDIRIYVDEGNDIRMANLSSEARALLQRVTELPLSITKWCGRCKMTLVIWGSSPRSLTAIRYRLTIGRAPLTSADLSTDVPLADILAQFEAAMYDEIDIDLILNQFRDPTFPREIWLDSIDELVEEVIQDVRIKKGIPEENDDDDVS